MRFAFWTLFVLTVFVHVAAQTAEPKDPAPLPAPSGVKPTMYCTGFAFAEGPAVDRDGNLYVVNYRQWGTIGKITREGAASILVDLRKALPADGDKLPSCNGLKIDDDGNLIGAETGTSQIVHISRDGQKVEVLAREVDGVRLNGLNDVALDPQGNIYFANSGQRNVYRINKRDGSIDRLNPEPIGSNGIGLTPDGKHLVTADSDGMRLMILDIVEGEGKNQRELISFKPAGTPDKLSAEEFQKLAEKVGVPDGFVFDEFGRLYLGMWTGKVVHVVEVPSGKLLATYPAGGSQATNVHFFQGDLYVTVAASEAVYKLPLGIRGWRYSKGCGY
ncbi:MAG TPA: SMP-30/gluconolactonase/LRE family protein [Pirellulales bacterium]|jgi:sugar lactone lactonase YvrE|nr:SMP-30/gluconolactonase/LRE family protein [Pirellulales bacterium]